MIANYKIDINENTAYLLEVLKVESYYNRKNFTLSLQNKDINFLSRIEDIVRALEMNISERLLIKIRLPNETKKEDVKIFCNGKELSFHIEKSPFDEKNVKAVTNQPFKNNYELKINYLNKSYNLNIKIDKKKIICKGPMDCWAYKEIRFPNNRIFEFLERCGGNKNDFSDYLLKVNTSIIMSAFSGLIDAEGSINWYNLTRKVRIRMYNKKYLEKWAQLLTKLKVGCKFRKNKGKEWEINISGWEDFNKLENFGLKFHHSEKIRKWKEMMGGFKRNQISRGSYREFYVRKLKEANKKLTAEEFSKILNKRKRVVSHHLLKLEKEKLISCDRNKWPYLYFISTSSVR